MKHRDKMFVLIVTISFFIPTSQISGKDYQTGEDWIDFAFGDCYPSFETAIDNQANQNGLAIDHSIDPENFTLELNITSMTETIFRVEGSTIVERTDKNTFENKFFEITKIGLHNFTLTTNKFTFGILPDSEGLVPLQFHSVRGSYRLFKDNNSLIFDWKPLALFACFPTSFTIFDDDPLITHNITTHYEVTQIGNGSLLIYYSSFSPSGFRQEIKTIGSFSINENAKYISIGYKGENGTSVTGKYLIEDHGVVQKPAPGFLFPMFALMTIVLYTHRKLRKKIE